MVPPDELRAPIRAKLDSLEKLFSAELRSDIPIIARINGHIASQAGKRVRPSLVFLAADLVGYGGSGDVTLAAVVEFIHTATLIHDDIIDDASTRRGVPSVNALWGNTLSVLLGDYLYLKSMELALRERSLRVLDVLTAATMTTIEGEMLEDSLAGDLHTTREAYLDVIRRKTAALFGACGQLAAVLAGADPEREEALKSYGLNVGMAFQIVDDMLDFVGDEHTLGKPVINDLTEGKLTLPVIELLERAEPDEVALVTRLVEKRTATAEDHNRLVSMLMRRGTLESSERLAEDYGRRALKSLAIFDDSPAKRVLEKVPDLLLVRTS